MNGEEHHQEEEEEDKEEGKQHEVKGAMQEGSLWPLRALSWGREGLHRRAGGSARRGHCRQSST